MALGTSPMRIALRPLLVGLEVAIGGVAFGVVVGLFVDHLVGNVLRSYLPLPVWKTGFQTATFAQGAALGVLVSFLAVSWPVVRAVRVPPVEAIRHTAVAPRGGRIRRARLPLARQQHRADAVPQRDPVEPSFGAHRARHRGDDGGARRAPRSRRCHLRHDRHRPIGDQRRRFEHRNSARSKTSCSRPRRRCGRSEPRRRLRGRRPIFRSAAPCAGTRHRSACWSASSTSRTGSGSRTSSRGTLDTDTSGRRHRRQGRARPRRRRRRSSGVAASVANRSRVRTGSSTPRFPVLAITNLPARFTVFMDQRWASVFNLAGHHERR